MEGTQITLPQHTRHSLKLSPSKVSQASMLQVIKARAACVGLSSQTGPTLLREERQRHADFFAGEEDSIITLRGKTRSDANPPDWNVFVRDTWLSPEVTRASEDKNDEKRNPLDRSDQQRYRFHLLETRILTQSRKFWCLRSRNSTQILSTPTGTHESWALLRAISSSLQTFLFRSRLL